MMGKVGAAYLRNFLPQFLASRPHHLRDRAMSSILNYGEDSRITFDLPPAALVAKCGVPSGEPLDDPAAAMAAALLNTLDYPPLPQCVVQGDRVTVAIGPGLPQLPSLVAGIVNTLLTAQVEPADITLLCTAADGRESDIDPRHGLADQVASQVQLVVHDPNQRDDLRYLAASADGKPIYLNRLIHEADVVLPVGCVRLDGVPGYLGIHEGLFPTFSDEQTIERFRAPISAESAARRKRRRNETEEVAWLLGISLTVQVIPAAGGQVLHILSGEVGEVLRRSGELCEQAWHSSVPRRAELVVAAIDGDAREQTWQNVARAIAAASDVVAEGGAIVICTDLETAPGPALRRLSAGDDHDSALRDLRRQRTVDALPASQLLHALDHATVYLLSRLDENVVEELGVAPVSHSDEIARLSRRFDSCILLANAQYARATPAAE